MNTNPEERKARYRQDPILNRVLNRMPNHVVDSFTELQLEAMRQAIAQPRKHSVDLRCSLPLIFESFYVVILAGPERRSQERLRRESKEHRTWTLGNLTFLAALATTLVVGTYGISSLFAQSSLADQIAPEDLATSHPTALPWIKTKEACTGPKRQWKNGLCFDNDWSRHNRR